MLALMKVAPGVGHVELREIAEPAPAPGEALVEVKAAGICGTDLHIVDDEFRTRPPVVMGHEAAGVVVAVGQGVDDAWIGRRVTSETYYATCGRCTSCRSGFVNLCRNRLSIGSGVNGAFAEYFVVPVGNLHALPEEVTFKAGALTEPVACCVHNLELTRVMPGDLAVVSGPGAIGLIVAQLLKACGAHVVVLGTDRDVPRLDYARALGVDYALNVDAEDPKMLLDEIRPAGADIVFECAGVGASASTCLDLVRRKGRYSQVGLVGKPVSLDLDQFCYKELVVTGSNASVPWAWEKALELIANKKVDTARLVTETFPLSEWETAFAKFRAKDGLKMTLAP